MKKNSLAARHMTLEEPTLTAFNTSKINRQRPGFVKLLPPPPQPDEKTLMELNALAARHPFCTVYKVKKHDPL